MIDNNTKIECFIQFLIDNNVYDVYMIACNTFNIRNLLLDKGDRTYVHGVFIWYETKEGIKFWSNINKKWIHQKDNYYMQYKRNELLNKIL